MAPGAKLQEILRQEETLAPEELERAAAGAEQAGRPLADWLVDEGAVDEEDLFFLLSRRLGVAALPEERLRHLALAPQLRRRVPRALASALLLIPLDLSERRLSVAMLDPSDERALARLSRAAEVPINDIRPYLARRSAILRAIESSYSDTDEMLLDEPDALDATGQHERTAPEEPMDGGDTQVVLIPGKVSVDAKLAQEIGAEGQAPAAAVEGELRRAAVGEPEIEGKTTVHFGRSLLREQHGAQRVAPPAAPPPPGAPRWPRGEREAAASVPPVPQPPAEAPLGLEAALPIEEGVAEDLEREVTRVKARVVDEASERTPRVARPEVVVSAAAVRADERDGLLRELLASVGVLVAMLEERIDPGDATSREYAQMSRAIARELGLDELTVARIALAGHLYGLDLGLRRELGGEPAGDVTIAFDEAPSTPGGLNPTLRMLGARALGLAERAEVPVGVMLIRLVSDYLDLRASDDESDLETVVQLLRAGGADSVMLDALVRVVQETEGLLIKTERKSVGGALEPVES